MLTHTHNGIAASLKWEIMTHAKILSNLKGPMLNQNTRTNTDSIYRKNLDQSNSHRDRRMIM